MDMTHSSARLRDESHDTPSSTSDGMSKSRCGLPVTLPAASSSPTLPAISITHALSHSIDFGTNTQSNSTTYFPRPPPFWLNSDYAKKTVEGNLITLSIRPRAVEQGE